jgi:hypothetical protein
MKPTEKYLYDENLTRYTLIMWSGSADKQDIIDCIKIFERFEDYEKCQDLLNILSSIEKEKDIGKTIR